MPNIVRVYWLLALALTLAGMTAAVALLHWGPAIQTTDARYAAPPAPAGTCESTATGGPAGRFERRTDDGVPYVLVTPRNYQPTRMHPLLLVYAPAGFGPDLSERYAGLTRLATSAGFLVAYAGSLPLGLEAVRKLSGVADAVVARWCVDPERIYATGHSDGGTVSMALATLPEYRGKVRSVAVSGVGWKGEDFGDQECPPPFPILISHGANDTHFPGFGRQAAQWWAACNGCAPDAREVDAEGCRSYQGCAAETVYCETDRSHWRWATEPGTIMNFLRRQDRADLAIR
ncbi:MAG: hypothetical protein PHP86_18665 [Nevskiales bacterium]|nr:hypothetical protein [Nevskiales bacterium]